MIELNQIEELKKQFGELRETVTSSFSSINSTSSSIDSISKSLATLSSNLSQEVSTFSNVAGKTVISIVGDKSTVQIVNILSTKIDLLNTTILSLKASVDNLVKSESDKGMDVGSSPKVTSKKTKSTASKALGSLTKSVNNLLGENIFGGGIISTLINLMIYGRKEQARMAAEAGEMRDIIGMAWDSSLTGAVRSAGKYYSNKQETLQRFYNINKSEYQQVFDNLVRAGIGIREFSQKTDITIKGLGSDVANVLFGIDKAFNVASGTAAKSATSLMGLYGYSLDRSTKSVAKLYQAGSEVGFEDFTSRIMSAAEAASGFGISIDDIVDVANTLQSHFEKMGAPKKFSAEYIQKGLQSIGSAIGGLSNDWISVLSEKMGYGTGAGGYVKFKDSLTKVLEKKNEKEFSNIMLAAYNVTMDAFGREDESTIALEQAFKSYEAAKLIMNYGKASKENPKNDIKLSGMSKQLMKTLKNSMKSEAEKFNDITKNINKVLKELSRVGMDLMALAANALAFLIVFLKDLFNVARNADDTKKAEGLMESYSEGMSDAATKLADHIRSTAKAAKGLGMAALGDSADLIARALRGTGREKPPSLVDESWRNALGGAGGEPTVYVNDPTGGVMPISAAGGKKPQLFVKTTDDKGVDSYQPAYMGSFAENPEQVANVQPISNIPNAKAISQSDSYPSANPDHLVADQNGVTVANLNTSGNSGDVPYGGYKVSSKDREALARMISSEWGMDYADDPNWREAMNQSMWTTANRMNTKYGKAKEDKVYNIVTAGKGFGAGVYYPEDGGAADRRPYSTKNKPSEKAYRVVDDFLAGKTKDLTQGSQEMHVAAEGSGAKEGARAVLPLGNQSQIAWISGKTEKDPGRLPTKEEMKSKDERIKLFPKEVHLKKWEDKK
jgi:hypothetical protein